MDAVGYLRHLHLISRYTTALEGNLCPSRIAIESGARPVCSVYVPTFLEPLSLTERHRVFVQRRKEVMNLWTVTSRDNL